jgi:hypothetical protein
MRPATSLLVTHHHHQPAPVEPDDGKVRVQTYAEGHLFSFLCPGCSHVHTYHTLPDNEPVWDWNGSVSKPTFYPSYRIRWGDGQCCHFFVTNGRIAFEPDSTHALAGKTVDLPEIPSA